MNGETEWLTGRMGAHRDPETARATRRAFLTLMWTLWLVPVSHLCWVVGSELGALASTYFGR